MPDPQDKSSIRTALFAEPATRRRGINSVETGVRVLATLVELNQPSSLKSIADAMGMEASQLHRYVSSLVNTGMVQQDAASGRYDLGPGALQVGLAALGRLDPIKKISTTAQEMADDKGYTSMLSIWSSAGPIIIHWFAGRPPLYTTLAVGSVLSLTNSATGHIFMTYADENNLEANLKAEGWSVPLAQTKPLVQISDRVRERGIATVDGTVAQGLRAFSCPVLGFGNTLIAALTVVKSDAMPSKSDPATIADLQGACAQLTAEHGGHSP